MKILYKQDFKKLLEDNPNRRFVFFEYEPEIFKDQLHITTEDFKPTFGAITLAPNTVEDLIIFEYDWDLLADYQDNDMFAILEENEIASIINELSKALKENKSFHCGVEELGFHAYNCNDCPNKCEEYYQWDKEMRGSKDGNE